MHGQRALDELLKVYLWIWRRIDVYIRLLFLCRRATASGWVHDCGASLFLFGRRIYNCGVTFFFVLGWIDSRCLLLACREQAQHSQQVNAFFHTT